MLVDLSIRDFVLIDRLDLAPAGGFTALTGETGAGKSIILDALSVALGGPAERIMIRKGATKASVCAAFSLAADHPAWARLEAADIQLDRNELLTLRRVIPETGAVRAYLNDQPVSAARLRELGVDLVEMHGQHAAIGLLRTQTHRHMLDHYAGNEGLLAACAEAWSAFEAALAVREALEAGCEAAAERVEALDRDLAALDEVAAEPGEADALATERAILAQGQRLREGLDEADAALGDGAGRSAIVAAGRAIDRLCRLPGLDAPSGPLGTQLHALRDGLERALIECDEAGTLLAALANEHFGDEGRLEAVEARLFAIRGLARRFEVDPDALAALRERLQAERSAVEANDTALADARSQEKACKARWHAAASRLTDARTSAAGRLEAAVARELKPLKLGGTRLRFALKPLPESKAGAMGQDQVSIEVETVKNAGFKPIGKIASGGELARMSLALRCVLADMGGAPVMVFDEADQGVGGAVAAAIGDRLAQLGNRCQVFAVTHSPQVAAAGNDQWRIEKRSGKDGLGQTRVSRLDDDRRLEEVARMLSGRTVTREARQAAARLLEGSCPRINP